MNVAFVSPYRACGAETTARANGSALTWYTRELASAIRLEGGDPLVVGPREAGAAPWSDDGVRILPSYARGSVFAPAAIGRAVRATSCDVVHVQHELFAYGGIATAFALPFAMRAFGRPIVTTIHGVIPLDRIDRAFVASNAIGAPPVAVRALWRALVRDVAARSDVVHVHETEHAAWLREQYGVRARIAVAPIGTAPAADASDAHDARERLGIPLAARVVTFFGYLLERKGIVPFLEAVDAMLAADPTLVIVVAGSVPERVAGAFDASTALERLRDRPRFRHLGFVADDDVADVFAAADVAIFPYTFTMSASGPVSLALGARRPVLLSTVFRDSYPEAPGLFEPTAAGIARTVAAFFADATFRERTRAYARDLAASRSWSAMARRMLEIYGTVSSARTRPPVAPHAGREALAFDAEDLDVAITRHA